MMPDLRKRKRQMNQIFFFVLAMLPFLISVSAITVELTADRNGTYVDENLTRITIAENESVKFQIKVYEGTKTSSGAFTISKETAANTYILVGKPHYAFAACLCTGARDMPDLNEEYTFIPLTPGKYRAEALYGGISRKTDIIVTELIPPASSSTTPIAKSSSTMLSTTSTTTEPATATTTTMDASPVTSLSVAVSSSTRTAIAVLDKTGSSFPWLPALLGLGIVSAFFLFILKRGWTK
jgi:hypothetical protein